MGKINDGRWIIGGLIATVLLFAINSVVNVLILGAHCNRAIGELGKRRMAAGEVVLLCAVTASEPHQCLAMLQRKPGERLDQMLDRVDAAIARAWVHEEFTDEINPDPYV